MGSTSHLAAPVRARIFSDCSTADRFGSEGGCLVGSRRQAYRDLNLLVGEDEGGVCYISNNKY